MNATESGVRRCPLCDQPSEDLICSADTTPTLAVVACSHREIREGSRLADRYDIKGVLGKGGYGRVHAAIDTRTGLHCAVKVMHVGDGPWRRRNLVRFAREAAITPILRDPHTVAVLANGQTQDGELFMILEWLHGESLADKLLPYARAYSSLPEPLVLQVGLSVLKSLAEAHSHGLVHRDIKPDNIYFHRVGDGHLVKLIDFGLARVAGSRLTMQGRALGTPAYMSPEQVMAQPLDQRSDLYALGCVLYECVTTEPPFADFMGPREVMGAHLNELPQPLHQRRPQADPALIAAIEKALQKSPSDRFSSAQEMDAALREVTLDTPSTPNLRLSGPSVRIRPQRPVGVSPAQLADVGFATLDDDFTPGDGQ